MKKGVAILCVIAVALSTFIGAKGFGQFMADIVPYKIIIDDVETDFKKPIVSINGTTYVPVREFCIGLGIPLDWNEKEKTVVINTEGKMDCNNLVLFDEKGVYSQDNSKYGFMDKNGKIVIPAQFDFAYNFAEGFAVVYKHPIDKEPPQFADVNAPYWNVGYINQTGELVLKDKYALSDFENGLAVVLDEGGQYVINKKMEKVFDVDYLRVMPFSDGFAAVQTKGAPPPTWGEIKWSYIDMTGKLATKEEFDEVLSFSEGMATVKKSGKWGVIDNKFRLVVDYQYDFVNSASHGLLMVEKDGKHGYVDKTGKVVIDLEYDSAGSFACGLASVEKDGKSGFINTKGEVVIPFKFDYALDFSEGMAAVMADNGKYGFINKKGEYVIEPTLSEASEFKKGLARVRSDENKEGFTYHYINVKGERIVPHK